MSKRSTHVLVTDPYLLPVSFAKRLTAAQYAQFLQTYAEDIVNSSFAVAPYTQKLQRQLRSNPYYLADYVYLM